MPTDDDAARFPCLQTAAPGAGGDARGDRRDVDAAQAIAAGADDVDQRPGERQRLGMGEHRPGQADDLLDRLPLGPEADEQAADLGGRGPALQHLAHDALGHVGPERLAGDQPAEHPWPPSGVREFHGDKVPRPMKGFRQVGRVTSRSRAVLRRPIHLADTPPRLRGLTRAAARPRPPGGAGSAPQAAQAGEAALAETVADHRDRPRRPGRRARRRLVRLRQLPLPPDQEDPRQAPDRPAEDTGQAGEHPRRRLRLAGRSSRTQRRSRRSGHRHPVSAAT